MSSVCRMCLAGNTSLNSVKSKQLINCYEKLTNAKLNSDDARPRALCSFCYQKLLRCYTFSQMALESEKILSHLYDRGLEVTHEYITEANIKHHLSVAKMQFIIIDSNNATRAGSKVTIKEEPLTSIDVKEKITLEPDKLLEVESFPIDCTTSQITFEEHINDQEYDTEELCSNTHIDQCKPDDTSFTFKNDPLSVSSIDIKEDITTELDTFVELEPLPEQSTRNQLTFEEDDSDQGKDVEELLNKIHVEQTKLDDSKLPFICNNCNKIFNRKSKLISHIRNSHSQLTGKQYFSTKKHTEITSMNKDKTFSTDKQLNRKCHLVNHIKIHTGEKPFACSICDKQFSVKCTSVSHMRTHTGEKPFACNICKKRFTVKGTLVKHKRTHTGEKPFACNICEKRFTKKCTLVSHMRTHTGEKPFACNICEKRFTEKGTLVKHKRTHTGEKPFACNICDTRFYQKCILVSHKTTHTGEKPFACNICEKRFTKKFTLVSHMRTHTGEKPFACNICDKRYTEKGALVKHKRTHTGEKPFACNVCDKQFYQKSILVSHMSIHTGEKPFACNVCDKRFNQQRYIVSHMRTHTREKPTCMRGTIRP